jgi:hypothetical protein
MFMDFQEAVVLVAGDVIFFVATFTFAGAILFGITLAILAGLRRTSA